MDHRFRKCQHILRSIEYRRVFDYRTSVADNVLVVYGMPNELGYSRLGLSVSRKVGNAVLRNWWKRRIREAFRLRQYSLPSGIDFVVIPRPAVRPRFDDIARSLDNLAARIGRKLDHRQNS